MEIWRVLIRDDTAKNVQIEQRKTHWQKIRIPRSRTCCTFFGCETVVVNQHYRHLLLKRVNSSPRSPAAFT